MHFPLTLKKKSPEEAVQVWCTNPCNHPAAPSSAFGFHPQSCLRVTKWLPQHSHHVPVLGSKKGWVDIVTFPPCLYPICCLVCLSSQPRNINPGHTHTQKALKQWVNGNSEPVLKRKEIKSRVLNPLKHKFNSAAIIKNIFQVYF